MLHKTGNPSQGKSRDISLSPCFQMSGIFLSNQSSLCKSFMSNILSRVFYSWRDFYCKASDCNLGLSCVTLWILNGKIYFQVIHLRCVEYKLNCNIKYIKYIHNFIIFPATCFGLIIGPTSGWSLNRWSVQLIMLSIYKIGPKHAAGIII